MFYNPPDNPRLLIDLHPGRQRLNGTQAEGFVRFRHMPMGDLDRNENQKIFMMELITQLLTREALLSNILPLAEIVIQDVRTNFGLVDAATFARYITNISPDNLHTFTMPGFIGPVHGIEYFRPSTDALPDIVNQVFFAHLE
jgi:anionic cell wall polymer biosynthesis LytR-Cps2A-Psr (LCP) family protein